jgi:hypothetical protein
MFYDLGSIDLDSICFDVDEKTCLFCNPWGASGFVTGPSGAKTMCQACHGTGKRGGKAHNLQPEIFQATRDEFIG